MPEIGPDFLDNIIHQSGGYNRANQYRLTITPPPDIDISTVDLDRIGLNCKTCTIPGRTIETKDMQEGGSYRRSMPHSVQYHDVNAVFMLSSDLKEKKFFDAWQDLMFDPIYQQINEYEKYAIGTVIIDLLDKNGEIIESYTLIECYVKTAGDVGLDYSTNDTINEYPVTFAYHSWVKGDSTE